LGLGLFLSLSSLACGGGASSGPADNAQQAVASTSARLEGNWTLVSFKPEQALEPMFAAFLTAQMNQLIVSFRGNSMTITGVGVTAERTFTVTHAAADGFDAVITDPTNVAYEVSGAFQGTDLAFKSKSDPWRGEGRLRRAR
jgi:hypothetical protein